MSLTPPRFHIADDMPMSLGKAIAREIAPQADPNAWFDAEARKHPDDKQPTWIGYDMAVSGSDKTIRAEYSLSGGTVTIRGAVEVAAPPSVQKFRVGDRVTTLEDGGDTVWILGSLRQSSNLSYPGQWDARQEKDKCHGILDPKLMRPAPSPASETETEGWVTWAGGSRPVAEDVQIEVRYAKNTPTDRRIGSAGSWTAGWSHETYNAGNIVAYRVVKP